MSGQHSVLLIVVGGRVCCTFSLFRARKRPDYSLLGGFGGGDSDSVILSCHLRFEDLIVHMFGSRLKLVARELFLKLLFLEVEVVLMMLVARRRLQAHSKCENPLFLKFDLKIHLDHSGQL